MDLVQPKVKVIFEAIEIVYSEVDTHVSAWLLEMPEMLEELS